MVVDDFGVVRITVFPGEADTSLLIDSDAVLAFTVAAEGFEVVARWHFQRFELCDCGNESEFVECPLLNDAGEFP